MPSSLVPAIHFSQETRVKNSRFIADIGPAFNVEQAREFIDQISQKFPDATHHVPAYIIGSGSSTIEHSNDDGEPSGTAGRPALSVLKGSGLGDTVLVITRYFGGTKLGTGGLVRAYSDAARQVVERVPKAEKITAHRVHIDLPYHLYDQIQRLIVQFQGIEIQEIFAEQVTISVSIPASNFDQFNNNLLELSSGDVAARILVEDQTALIPKTITKS
jgi:uncharacterized YigZ family protein